MVSKECYKLTEALGNYKGLYKKRKNYFCQDTLFEKVSKKNRYVRKM